MHASTIVGRRPRASGETVPVGSLLVVTGPPGSGKSAVARALVTAADRSVLVAGDAFFGFLASGAVDPWLPASHEQNTIVTRAAAQAAGGFAAGGYTTVFDGIVGPWFLPTFAEATGLERLDYVVLMPDVETCVTRVRTRSNHGFNDEAATRKMHAEFSAARVDSRHVIDDPPGDVDAVAALVSATWGRGDLEYVIS
jgi:dephospho-CoA kinase